MNGTRAVAGAVVYISDVKTPLSLLTRMCGKHFIRTYVIETIVEQHLAYGKVNIHLNAFAKRLPTLLIGRPLVNRTRKQHTEGQLDRVLQRIILTVTAVKYCG